MEAGRCGLWLIWWAWSGRDITLWAGSPHPILSTTDYRFLADGEFEWNDGLMLTSAQEPASRIPAETPKSVAPSPFSRFTVSPAPASRFSITHVSDSDSGSVGGKALVGRRGPVLIISCFLDKLSFQMGELRLGEVKSRQACLLWPPWCVFSPPWGDVVPQTELTGPSQD